MASVRLALAQINPTVGDLSGNASLILEAVREASEQGAQLIALPEMALTGYPIEDLALRPGFQRASMAATRSLAADLAEAGLAGVTVVTGVLNVTDGVPQNAGVVIAGGEITHTYIKHHLPNYGVFDERRLFAPGQDPCVFVVGGLTFSLAICEDLWQPDSPAEQAAAAEADVLLVINASPYEKAKDDARLELCRVRAAQTGCTVAYVNCVGGQDELVFDGGSMIVRADGSVAGSAPRFVSQILYSDLSEEGAADGIVADDLADVAEVYEALVLGLRDYVRKNGMKSVVLGLSGGIDSALVAAIAADAIGGSNVYGVAMPSIYSSGHSIEDAVDLATRTGVNLRTVPIAPMVDAFQSQLHLSGLAEENIQARVRGTTLMAISNSEGHLVLATGNKSELAVGYSTIYGDAVGGFGPIKDVLKTLVWDLSRWRNELAVLAGETPPIPERSIEKEPSAELRPDQFDTDSLPDYAVLDAVLTAYVERGESTDELVEQGFDHDLVTRIIRMTDGAEWKRRQYPPGTKITKLAFGRDRRLPITNRWR